MFFKTREEAEKAGFRPCKRCRPDLVQFDPTAELSARAKSLIDRNYGDRLLLASDMKQVGVSRKHLTEIFRKQYDMTPSEYLSQVRISAARGLLQDGVSISDAAAMAGYETLSEFYGPFTFFVG